MANKCPVCLKEFAERRDLLTHMKHLRHSIDGSKAFVRDSDEYRMEQYHPVLWGKLTKNGYSTKTLRAF